MKYMKYNKFTKLLVYTPMLIVCLLWSAASEGAVQVNLHAPIYAQWVVSVENAASCHKTMLTTLLDGPREKFIDVLMSARNIKECGQGTLKLLPQAVQQSINTSLWEDIFFLVPSTKGIYWVPFSRRDTIPEQEQAKIVPVLKLFVPFPTENESLLRNKAIARIRRSYPLLSSTEDKQGINILILPNVTHIQTLLEQTIKTQQDLLAE